MSLVTLAAMAGAALAAGGVASVLVRRLPAHCTRTLLLVEVAAVAAVAVTFVLIATIL